MQIYKLRRLNNLKATIFKVNGDPKGNLLYFTSWSKSF